MCESKLQRREEEGMDLIINHFTIFILLISRLRLAFRPHLLMRADLKTSNSNQLLIECASHGVANWTDPPILHITCVVRFGGFVIVINNFLT